MHEYPVIYVVGTIFFLALCIAAWPIVWVSGAFLVLAGVKDHYRRKRSMDRDEGPR